MRIRSFLTADEPALIRLWERCGLTRPWNDPHKAVAHKLAVRPDLLLVAVLGTGYAGGPDGEVAVSDMRSRS